MIKSESTIQIRVDAKTKREAKKTLGELGLDHALKGDLVGFRECHIAPDILLIYCLEDGVLILTLVNIGNHAQLFE